MKLPFGISVQALIAAVVCSACFAFGYSVADWRLTSKADELEVSRTREYVEQRDEAIAAYTHLANELATSNDKHLADLKRAQDATNAIRDGNHSGNVRLRVAGKCTSLPTASTSTTSSSVDTGTGAELDPTARRAYFFLRDAIDRSGAQLVACQDELRLRT